MTECIDDKWLRKGLTEAGEYWNQTGTSIIPPNFEYLWDKKSTNWLQKPKS